MKYAVLVFAWNVKFNRKSPHPPFGRRRMGDKEMIRVDRRTVYGSSEVTVMPWV